jgi:hypothetical protein
MRASKFVSLLLIFLPVFFSSRAWAQTQSAPQGQASVLVCRPWEKTSLYYQNKSTYIAPNEFVVGNEQICHVEAATSAPAAPPPAPAPPAPPAPAPPAPVVTPTPVPVRADTVQQTPQPIPPKPEPRADGRKLLYVTDNLLDQSTFIARNSSYASARGQMNGSGQVSGNSAGWNGSSNVNGSYNAQQISNGAAYGFSERGADPRTIEIQTDLFQSCPQIIVTDDISKADFVLFFRRDNGKRQGAFALGGLVGLAASSNAKVDGTSVFNAEGNMVYATRARTVRKAIEDVCKNIR